MKDILLWIGVLLASIFFAAVIILHMRENYEPRTEQANTNSVLCDKMGGILIKHHCIRKDAIIELKK